MPEIQIEAPEVDGRTLRTTVVPSRGVARFFGDPLEVTYDVSIEDVPESVLIVPALAQVCPVAWATGADVTVDTVDATFVEALNEIKPTMFEMYDFFEGGKVRARNVVDTERIDDDGSNHESSSALLFTGGVDSTSSYLRHREECPTVVSIRGWTVNPGPEDDEKWQHMVERTNRFAQEVGTDAAFVEGNMLSFLEDPMLLAHYKRFVDGAWYSSVGHGLGLLGLCAPLAFARGFDDLYIAATHWEGIDLEWGSRPDIDDNVRWAGTTCHHTNYDLTRQERLDLIADFVEEEGIELELHTCNDFEDRNCGTCEKCYRTGVGLRLSGLEPEDHGYEFSQSDYREIMTAFENGTWELGKDEQYMWEDIQERSREVEAESVAEAEFFEWLDEADLSALVDHSGPPLSHRLIRAGARNTPNPVYRAVYPVWSGAKSGYRRIVSKQ